MAQDKNSTRKIKAGEGIRGLGSLIVVIYHLILCFYPGIHNFDNNKDSLSPVELFIHDSPLGFLYCGTTAVFMFFLLSGYILTHAIFRQGDRTTQIISMCLRRCLRLMIPVVVVCVMTFFLFDAIDVKQDYLTRWISGYGTGDFTFLGTLYSAIIDTFFISGETRLSPVLWTMKVELSGSFMIFLFCALKGKKFWEHVPVLFFALLMYLMATGYYRKVYGLGLIMIIIGYWLYWYAKPISWKYAVLPLIAGLYFSGAHNTSLSYQWLINLVDKNTYLFGASTAAVLLFYVILFNKEMSERFSHPTFVYMGELSFAVYLLHMPVLYGVGLTTFNGMMDHHYSYFAAAMSASALTLAVTYLLSIPYYRVVDIGSIRAGNLFAKFVIKRFRPV